MHFKAGQNCSKWLRLLNCSNWSKKVKILYLKKYKKRLKQIKNGKIVQIWAEFSKPFHCGAISAERPLVLFENQAIMF